MKMYMTDIAEVANGFRSGEAQLHNSSHWTEFGKGRNMVSQREFEPTGVTHLHTVLEILPLL